MLWAQTYYYFKLNFITLFYFVSLRKLPYPSQHWTHISIIALYFIIELGFSKARHLFIYPWVAGMYLRLIEYMLNWIADILAGDKQTGCIILEK